MNAMWCRNGLAGMQAGPGRKGRGSYLAMVLLLALFSGCSGRSMGGKADINIDVAWEPSPPTKGAVHAKVVLTTGAGEPVTAEQVQLEGNMNHAGMKPTFADLHETSSGTFEGDLDFTMGGDWYVTVTATLDGGQQVQQVVQVPGVRVK